MTNDKIKQMVDKRAEDILGILNDNLESQKLQTIEATNEIINITKKIAELEIQVNLGEETPETVALYRQCLKTEAAIQLQKTQNMWSAVTKAVLGAIVDTALTAGQMYINSKLNDTNFKIDSNKFFT